MRTRTDEFIEGFKTGTKSVYRRSKAAQVQAQEDIERSIIEDDPGIRKEINKLTSITFFFVTRPIFTGLTVLTAPLIGALNGFSNLARDTCYESQFFSDPMVLENKLRDIFSIDMGRYSVTCVPRESDILNNMHDGEIFLFKNEYNEICIKLQPYRGEEINQTLGNEWSSLETNAYRMFETNRDYSQYVHFLIAERFHQIDPDKFTNLKATIQQVYESYEKNIITSVKTSNSSLLVKNSLSAVIESCKKNSYDLVIESNELFSDLKSYMVDNHSKNSNKKLFHTILNVLDSKEEKEKAQKMAHCRAMYGLFKQHKDSDNTKINDLNAIKMIGRFV